MKLLVYDKSGLGKTTLNDQLMMLGNVVLEAKVRRENGSFAYSDIILFLSVPIMIHMMV